MASINSNLVEKGRPCCITDRFRQTMGVNHPIHMEIFHTDETGLIDNLSRMLMGEILTTPRDPLMDTSNNLAMCAPLWRPFRKLRVLTLHLCQGFLFSTKEVGIRDFLSIGKRGKGLQAYINAHGVGFFWQAFGFSLTGERGVPFASAALVDSECFDVAANGAMVDHFDGANLGEADPVLVGDAKARLRKGERVIAVLAREAWR